MLLPIARKARTPDRTGLRFWDAPRRRRRFTSKAIRSVYNANSFPST